MGSVPGWGRSPGEGNGNPLQLAWEIPWTEELGGLHRVTKSRTQSKTYATYFNGPEAT